MIATLITYPQRNSWSIRERLSFHWKVNWTKFNQSLIRCSRLVSWRYDTEKKIYSSNRIDSEILFLFCFILQKTLTTYKIELAWLKVQNEENLQQEIVDTLGKYQKIYDDLMNSMNNRQKNDENRAARCELLTEQMNELRKEKDIEAAQQDQMRRNISKDEESRNGIDRNLQKIQKKLDTVLKNIKELEDDMSESSES